MLGLLWAALYGFCGYWCPNRLPLWLMVGVCGDLMLLFYHGGRRGSRRVFWREGWCGAALPRRAGQIPAAP